MKMRATILVLIIMLFTPASFPAKPAPQTAPNISVSASAAADKVRRGRSLQGMVVMGIPSGYHVNSNRPLEKFLIATQLKIEAPKGIRVGAVVYPRAVLRNFKFSKNRVSVYEGRATMRFNVAVPANFSGRTIELKAHLRYQSCNDEVCFPPQSRDVSLWLKVE